LAPESNGLFDLVSFVRAVLFCDSQQTFRSGSSQRMTEFAIGAFSWVLDEHDCYAIKESGTEVKVFRDKAEYF